MEGWQIIDASPVALSVDDMKGGIEYVNRKFEEKFGYTLGEIPTSAAWFERAYPDPAYRRMVAAQWNELIEEGLRSGREIGPLRVEVTCKDGSVRKIEFIGTRVGNRLFIAGNDTTERERLEQEVLRISEQERERIGQDLHDGLCQFLGGVKFRAALLEQKLSAAGSAQAREAAEIEGLLNRAIEQGRDLARGLQPVELGSGGLMSALENLAAAIGGTYGVKCLCRSDGPVLLEDHTVATHLYRIAQEACVNAAKHGRPSHIRITVAEQNGALALRVENDGLPFFGSRPAGLGLRLMHYRARAIGASLKIESGRHGGAIVSCRWCNPAPKTALAK